MFKNLKEFFLGKASLEVDREGKLTSTELQVVTAALLLEMAYADSNYTEDEYTEIIHAMVREFRLSEEEANELLSMAEGVSGNKGNMDEFLRSINDNFDVDQKQLVLAMIWKVARADGKIDEVESAFTSRIRSKLGLTLEHWAKAMEIAEKGNIKLE